MLECEGETAMTQQTDDVQVQATLREAAEALGVDEEDLNYFADVDPFNDGNELEGALCRVEDHRYGALYLRRVNGKYKPQVVFCTPKIGYPFSPSPDGARVYRFPPVTKVAFYEKIDGCFEYHTRVLLADGTTEYIGNDWC